jgi:hypothetical protein
MKTPVPKGFRQQMEGGVCFVSQETDAFFSTNCIFAKNRNVFCAFPPFFGT